MPKTFCFLFFQLFLLFAYARETEIHPEAGGYIPGSNCSGMPGATHFGSHEQPKLLEQVFQNFFTASFVMTSTIEKNSPKKKDAVENSPTQQ